MIAIFTLSFLVFLMGLTPVLVALCSTPEPLD